MPKLNIHQISNFVSFEEFVHDGLPIRTKQGRLLIKWDGDTLHYHQLSSIGLFFHRLGLYLRSYNRKNLLEYLIERGASGKAKRHSDLAALFKQVINKPNNSGPLEDPSSTRTRNKEETRNTLDSKAEPTKFDKATHWTIALPAGKGGLPANNLAVTSSIAEIEQKLPAANYFFIFCASARFEIDAHRENLRQFRHVRSQDERYKHLPYVLVITRLGEEAQQSHTEKNSDGKCEGFIPIQLNYQQTNGEKKFPNSELNKRNLEILRSTLLDERGKSANR